MSDCGVCVYSDSDGESCDFMHEEIRKARKPHTCCECRKTINIGERYEHVRFKFDGEVNNCDTCLICVEIAEAFYCDGRVLNEGLWENMSYVMAELTTSCFDKLTFPEAKSELRRRWMEWKGIPA